MLDSLHRLQKLFLVQSEAGQLRVLEPIRRFAASRTEPQLLATAATHHARWVSDQVQLLLAQARRDPATLDRLVELTPEYAVCLQRAETGQVASSFGHHAANGLTHAAMFRGSAVRAIAHAERGLQLPFPDDEPSVRVTLMSIYGQRLAAEGRRESVDVLEQSCALAEEHISEVPVRLYVHLGAELQLRGKSGQAREALERARSLCPTGSDDWAWASAECAQAAHDLGDAAAADALLAESLHAARLEKNRRIEVRALEIAATIAVERGDQERGQATIAAFRALSTAFGEGRKVALADLYDGQLLEMRGEFAPARERYLRARNELERLDAVRLTGNADGQLARVCMAMGDFEQAASWLEQPTPGTPERRVYQGVLAALHADLPTTLSATRDGGTAARLAELARAAAHVLACPLDSIEPDAVERLAQVAARVTDPTDRQLVQPLVMRVAARVQGWVVSADGRWARTPGRGTIDVSKSRANAALLSALADTWTRRAEPLSVTAIAATVWPGEQLVEKSARSRVFVALSALRKAGLEPLLLRTSSGWYLDPEASVYIEPVGLR